MTSPAPGQGHRAGSAGPVLAAAVVTLLLVAAVLLARPAAPSLPPAPVPFPTLPPDRSPPDRVALALDRCAAALVTAGLAAGYPPREEWVPLARLSGAEGVAAVVAAPVPFVCAAGPTVVEVSDPAAAVPAGGALLLLTAPSGVQAAVAGSGGSVAVAGGVPGPVSLRRAPDPAAVALEVDGAPVQPARGAPPALRVVDRREIPPDQSAEAVALLGRCTAAGPGDRPWQAAVVLEHDGGTVVVAAAAAAVGGCVVTPGRAQPVRVWRIGTAGDGPRPFAWVAGPPGAPPDVAAGTVEPGVVRMEVTAPGGPTWTAVVAGRAFVTRLPAGVAPDPAVLVVRALDADGVLLYEGPAG